MGLGNHLEELAGQMHSAAATYAPDGMLQWGRDMRSVPEAIRSFAMAINRVHAGADDLPINPAVRDALSAVIAQMQACAGAADEIHSTFRAAHADDIARHEAPRPNEQLWDVQANQA